MNELTNDDRAILPADIIRRIERGELLLTKEAQNGFVTLRHVEPNPAWKPGEPKRGVVARIIHRGR